MLKCRITSDANPFHATGVEVQKRIFHYLHSKDKHSFAMTESRIQRAFHPKFFVLHHLREKIAQVRSFEPNNLIFSWNEVSIFQDYFARAEAEVNGVFEKVEERLPFPFTLEMK